VHQLGRCGKNRTDPRRRENGLGLLLNFIGLGDARFDRAAGSNAGHAQREDRADTDGNVPGDPAEGRSGSGGEQIAEHQIPSLLPYVRNPPSR
jgi:hypothetical protein